MITYINIFYKIFIVSYNNNVNFIIYYTTLWEVMMKKQIIAATALMLAISSTAYASDNINIFVNGNP